MKVLAKEHTLQTPEGPVKMDGLELLITRHFKDSISGKSAAAKMMWARIDANGIGREDETETLTESDERILDQYMELFRGQKKAQDDV